MRLSTSVSMEVDLMTYALSDMGPFGKLEDVEASFAVNLFPDGFSIGKPTEKGKVLPPAIDVMDMLYPYNRSSESFLRALDGGWLPGDLLEDIPCKYIDGAVICEIRDYRDNVPLALADGGIADVSKACADWMPVVHMISLQPSTESIVKDVLSMVDETWSYKDLVEVESRILKAARPALCLDAKPHWNGANSCSKLNRQHNIIKNYRTRKGTLLNHRLRLAAGTRAMVKAGSLANSKKISFDWASEKLNTAPTLENPNAGRDIEALVSGGSAIRTRISTGLDLSGKHGLFSLPQTMSLQADERALTLDALAKRDKRTDIRKSTQEHFKLERSQSQKSSQSVDLTVLSDQQLKDKIDLLPQQPVGKVSRQDTKYTMDSGNPFSSDVRAKQESDYSCFDYQEVMEKVKVDTESLDIEKQQEHQQEKQEYSSEQFVHHSTGKLQPLQVQHLEPLSQFGDRDMKRDESSRKRKLQLQNAEGRSSVQSPVGSKYSDSSTPLSPPTTPGGPTVPISSLGQSKERSQTQATTSVGFGHLVDQALQLQQLPANNSSQLARRRVNSMTKFPTSGVASPGSATNSAICANINSPSIGSAPIANAGLKAEPSILAPGQKREPLDNLSILISVAQRHGLPPTRKGKEECLLDGKKTVPSWQLLSIALGSTFADDYKEPKGQRNMADSLVGGNVNTRKSRCLRFQRIEQLYQGAGGPILLRYIKIRLVMCERAKDSMVEAVVQLGDEQDDESLTSAPHYVLPTMANAHAADLFAKQFCSLLEKDGFELVEDQVQPAIQRPNAPINAASAARPMLPGASTIGSNIGQLASPRVIMNQQLVGGAVSGISALAAMQPSSPNSLSTVRMPSPGNASNRHLHASYLGQMCAGTTSKPLQLDGSSIQLANVQQQQQQQPQMQRVQQLATAAQIAQLHPSTHNTSQQLNPHISQNQNQLQKLQYLQQRQQQPAPLLPRMLPGVIGGLGTANNISGVGLPVSGGTQGSMPNVMGLAGGVNSVVGMAGMTNVSAAMVGISGLTNVGQLSGLGAIGQNAGFGNIMSQQLRAGSLNPALNVPALTKVRLAQGRAVHSGGSGSPIMRNSIDTFSALNATNQVQSSAALPMMGPTLSRGVLNPIQHGMVGSMGTSKVTTPGIAAVSGQNIFVNSQQINAQQQLNMQQQLSSQHQQEHPLNGQTQLSQQQLNASMQLNSQQQQHQQANSQQPLTPQQHLNPQQQLKPQQQISSQTQIGQQLNSPQQLNSQQVNPSQQPSTQHSGGALAPMVSVAGSPQLSSQTLGSVSSITSSPMDLQSPTRG